MDPDDADQTTNPNKPIANSPVNESDETITGSNSFPEIDPLQTKYNDALEQPPTETHTVQPQPITPPPPSGKPNSPPQQADAFSTPPLQQPVMVSQGTQDSYVKFDTPESKKASRGLKLFIGFLFFTILLAAAGGGLFVVVYGKVDTPLPSDIKEKISFFVQSLPFTPKTPKYLLIKTALAQEEVKVSSFDVSAALNFSETDDLFGMNSIDFAIKGVSDITDPKNIQTSFNLAVTKDFNADFRKKDKMLYFKINKLPAFLLAFAGIDAQKLNPLLNRWVSYDTTPMDTEARKLLDEPEDKKDSAGKAEAVDVDKIFDEKILNEVKVVGDILDGNSVYKLTLNADDETLNYIFKKLESEFSQGSRDLYLKDSNAESQKVSDFIKNTKVEIVIDKERFYTRKMTLSFDMVNNQKTAQAIDAPVLGDYSDLFSPNSTATFAMVAKMDDFGKAITIDVPEATDEVITFEQFSSELSGIMLSIYSPVLGGLNPEKQLEMARDAQRKSDINMLRLALDAYYAVNMRYPQSLDELVASGELTKVPINPDGSSYYYKVTGNGKAFDLCTSLAVPEQLYDTCPDPSYNYHFKSLP